MKKNLLICLLFTISITLYSQTRYWISPATVRPDFWQMFSDEAKWDTLLSRIDVFSFHVNAFTDRTDRALINSAVQRLNSAGVLINFECGGLRPFSGCNDLAGENHALLELQGMNRWKSAGGNIDYISMDSPINTMIEGGDPNGTCDWTVEHAANEMVDYMKAVKEYLPNVKFALVEPVPWYRVGIYPNHPGNNYGDLLKVLDTVLSVLSQRGESIEIFHSDSPYEYSDNQQTQGWLKLKELEDYLHGKGLRHGRINNSQDGGFQNDKLFMDRTLESYNKYNAVGGEPDEIEAWCWYDHPSDNYPEWQPYSFTYSCRKLIDLVEFGTEEINARLDPGVGKIYHGVGQAMTGVQEYMTAMSDSTIMPIAHNFYYDIPGTRGDKFAELRTIMQQKKAIGMIPHLSIAMTSGPVWTDSIIANSTQYDYIIDSLANIVKDYGLKIFIRPGFEFNGSWFPYHPYQYPKAFQKIVNKFRAVANPDSMAFLWCYYPAAPNDFDSVDGRGSRWYPGDEYVDWFSLDVFGAADFHPDSVSIRRGAITKKGKSEEFLAMARAKNKPVFLSEVSAAYTNITSNTNDGMNDWNAWFVPFFEFMTIHPEIRGFNYTNWDWSEYGQWKEWGDSRIEINQYILGKYKEEMENTKYIHLRTGAVVPPQDAKFEPPDGRVYHGAQLMTYETTKDPIEGYLTKALNDSTIQPAVRGFFFSIPGTRGPAQTLKGLADFYHSADSVGFFPELSLFFVSDVATDSIIANSTVYDEVIDSIITLSKNYGKRIFLRIGGEFNGAGPGWNGGGYHPYEYVKMYRKITDMFESRGFRDSIAVIWCYEPDAPNDFDSVDARGARWYPGDEYADWFGLDVFDAVHFDQSLPDFDRGQITRKGKSERFLAMARDKNKPVYMSETSAKGVNISADNQDGINDWNNWFVKFWEFIEVHPEIKGFSYINANWPSGAYPNWGDARIENSPYVTQKYREEMHDPRYIHLPVKLDTVVNDTLPLTELGTGKWKNYEGGLYPNGLNERPAQHNNDGIQIGKSIVPLNTQGSTDPNGKIVLLSVGMSNCTQEFSAFKQIADIDTMKNPKCIIIDGAQGGQTAAVISNPSATFWNIIETRLDNAGLKPEQVQAVWLKEADAQPKDAFPVHAQTLQREMKAIVKILKEKYPNIKIAYLSSRTYGGYATTQLNPEPYAYETGFSVKWLIEEQINGDTTISYSGIEPKSPWLAWGPYLWAKGEKPREDNGLFWLREDFVNDGTHPSTSGRAKVANLLLDFMKTDSTAIPWFIKKPSTSVEEEQGLNVDITLYPNPAEDYITINSNVNEGIVEIYSVIGYKLIDIQIRNRIDVRSLPSGIYFVKYRNQVLKFVKF